MIPNILEKIFGPSWRTSAISAATAICGFVACSPQLFVHYPILIEVAKYASLGGFVTFGINAKDSAVGQKTIIALRAELEAERAKNK